LVAKSVSLFLLAATLLTTGCRSQNLPTPPSQPLQASPSPRTYVVADDHSSLIYIQPASPSAPHRLTNTRSWETDPTLSNSGKLIAYARADRAEAKSEVWVAHTDGSSAHRVSGPDEDAILPTFAPDELSVLYVKSRFNGHYSPIARPRRHKFDIVRIPIGPDGFVPSAQPQELTQQSFFDMRSLKVSPDGEHFLVATSDYPIGSLIMEFEIAHPLATHKIFQPHVPGEPSFGAQFGQAAFSPDGMDIVFTAATEGKSGMFDYNIYKMSDVTGAELVKLADHAGVIDRLDVASDGIVHISASGERFSINPVRKMLTPE
jgi:dipeptidyl aminopeptidase/acylaminoacyl peptidase